jgi:pyruvate dehydrogenase E2 component (dihydrolipoamide acetyltransferase)
MPSLGADMERGRVTEWRVKEGGAIKRGQVLVTIETDKGLIDVECFHEGVLTRIVVPEGNEVKVGAVIAQLDVQGGAASTSAAPERTPPNTPAAETQTAAMVAPPSRADGERVRASPLAKRRAHELGVDLASVTTTGERITAEDVERAALQASKSPAPPRDPKEAMRRAIAASMAKSKREIPHYYLWQSVDVSTAQAWLAAENERRPVTARLLFAVLVARAVARAAHEFSELNGSYVDGAFQPATSVNLCFATSQRGGGLIAPAIFDAHAMTVDALMEGIKDVVQRVRAGSLTNRMMTEGTITLTSLGDLGVEGILPVIQPPQVAIVGAGAVVQRPWVVGGAVVARPVMTLALAADHRTSDGARGARFLQAIAKNLEHPEP